MADRFFVEGALGPGQVVLEGPEAHHLATVCRARADCPVRLFNGDGCEYPARVRSASHRKVILEVTGVDRPDRELPFRLEVAAPLPRGDRGQFLVEKLTEIGVTSYIPLRTSRSVIDPRATRLDRLQRQVIEASKQCARNRLLEIGAVTDWEAYCAAGELPESRILAHPKSAGLAISSWKEAAAGPPVDRVVAVGPEGGLTGEEIARAIAHGWKTVHLGPRILRVETAALALAALCALPDA